MLGGRFLCSLVLMSDVPLVRVCVLFKKDQAPLIISGKKNTVNEPVCFKSKQC